MPIDYLHSPLGDLARDIPGATRVFHDFRLDFCCNGHRTLAEAARLKHLDPQQVVDSLHVLCSDADADRDWTRATPAELIDHILRRFHARHREQLPELIRLARRVEQVHGGRSDCPIGLADHLADMLQELESHMLKEEQILFPMLARGMTAMAGGPISVMRYEHEQHGDALEGVIALTNDITPPAAACNTWQALYRGLEELRRDLMEHIHLENTVLFAAALAPPEPESPCCGACS
ncbi:iron-sulfur cluster repair protein YtfE [Halopseudomonas nanhaiensis]|uniref:iron-sulfur cluster repair protein YtfE n=1 Tax=Halopseudomonas nanhaiensis TaxID=2830842 RepID=UPI001CC179BF|nr:iron-sulfur cluster repair protein YtfE [Halopseudomonas nanhaiensis]UAW99362.1 iron-sulfur cluster repair protein YtfE [Halopseudomonas nanhaiensis]